MAVRAGSNESYHSDTSLSCLCPAVTITALRLYSQLPVVVVYNGQSETVPGIFKMVSGETCISLGQFASLGVGAMP